MWKLFPSGTTFDAAGIEIWQDRRIRSGRAVAVVAAGQLSDVSNHNETLGFSNA